MKNMAYTVEFSERARRDISGIVAYIQADSALSASRWRETLFDKMSVLSVAPKGFGVAPESALVDFTVRQMTYGRYRLLFTVDDDQLIVQLLTVRHSARQFMGRKELEGIE